MLRLGRREGTWVRGGSGESVEAVLLWRKTHGLLLLRLECVAKNLQKRRGETAFNVLVLSRLFSGSLWQQYFLSSLLFVEFAFLFHPFLCKSKTILLSLRAAQKPIEANNIFSPLFSPQFFYPWLTLRVKNYLEV